MENILSFYKFYIESYLFFYLLAAFLLLEALFKLNKKQPNLTNETLHNLGWVALNDYGIPVLENFIISYLRVAVIPLMLSFLPDTSKLPRIEIQSVFLLAILIFISRDFLSWSVHRLLHQNKFLWRIHKLHHSSTTLNSLSGSRGHWFENICFDLAMSVPLIIFAVPMQWFVWIALWEAFLTFFIHSNINIRNKGLYAVLTSPFYHHWHHSKKLHFRYGQNFGGYTNLFDRLFGTYYCPDDLPTSYGIQDKSYPTSYLGRFFHPFIMKSKK